MTVSRGQESSSDANFSVYSYDQKTLQPHCSNGVFGNVLLRGKHCLHPIMMVQTVCVQKQCVG